MVPPCKSTKVGVSASNALRSAGAKKAFEQKIQFSSRNTYPFVASGKLNLLILVRHAFNSNP